jgi:ribosomal protein S18 acetylase RimI-like enzyme
MHTRETFPPEERIALWERADGELDGFAWYYPKGREAALQPDPRLRGSDAYRRLAGEMLAWADERHAADPGATEARLTISVSEADAALIDRLAAHGFARTDDPPMRFHRQSLAGPLPESVLPEGYTVRAVREDELEQRVEIHREVWHPSKFTLAGYRQLRAAPGYDPELDIVAVAPDGTLAAYAICWHDAVNRSGEFEPVGTREAFRGRGLAKAVLLETMRRLQARECETAYVIADESREPSCRLYLSAGFEIANRWHAYRRVG